MRFSIFQVFWLLTLPAALAGEVTLRQDENTFRLSNGELTATIRKSNGRVASVTLDGRELTGDGGGYWSMAASSGRTRVLGFGSSASQSVSIDPAANGGERAEVVCRFDGKGGDGAFPGKVEVRYAIDRNSTTLYATAWLSHGAGDGPFRIGEGRFVIKLNDTIFDRLTIDKERNRVLPSAEDWERGTELNLKEVRRITTGPNAGHVEHKYAYSTMLGEVPAYGWVGDKQPFGVWMINPSTEYIAGGPTKMELTGHLDVGGKALPTLLNMWHGSHYGGSALSLAQDEAWSKVIGPFALHFNKGGDAAGLWKSALERAEVERKAWPYAWEVETGSKEPAPRGGVDGKLAISEKPVAGTPGKTVWVGLTAPDYTVGGRRGSSTVGWQRDGKFYQYWTKAAADGSFSLRGVRPGEYVLRAFADGIEGEFAQAGVKVAANERTQAGEIKWTPERAGPTLWEIGWPDRSAAEFRNGDRYWEWGSYLKFKADFPKGVDYTVGRSDWKKDWHLCQPLDLTADCKVLGPSTWTIRFALENVPADGARLRISFCGSREGAKLDLALNGSPAGTTGPLPEAGTMHRDSHRGMWFERTFDFPASALRSGENRLELRLSGTVWHQGVLYDYLRLEAVAPAVKKVP